MILRLRTRLAALVVATALGLVGAVSLTATSAAPDPDPPTRTRFDDLLAGHHAEGHPPGASATNDQHTDHQEMP